MNTFQPPYLKVIKVLLFLSFSLTHTQSTARNPQDPPNIILIMSDDQGYDDLGFRDKTHQLETPNLDNLAAESVEFTDFHAQPLCAPSRASLLTGREFLRTGVWGGSKWACRTESGRSNTS